ncbi:MAG: DUF5060 domain-containing protein, partial [Sedimentisphaerales bacterium]|nr:DUF5060 domain-containing protein [Sedimentisphaerales bacterium]
MTIRHLNRLFIGVIFLLAVSVTVARLSAESVSDLHVWQMQEIRLEAQGKYDNYYKEVTCWVELRGPGFARRVYGFWDGGAVFVVRVVATKPGRWEWVSGSNRVEDTGLNGQSGGFNVFEWTEEEKLENPNRRGFVRSSPNGHALQYADGTPFFMAGDT